MSFVGTRHAKVRKTIHKKMLLGTKQQVSGNNRQLTCAKKLISDSTRFFKNFMRQLCQEKISSFNEQQLYVKIKQMTSEEQTASFCLFRQ